MIWVVEADGQNKKKGRGVVKGVKVAQKRFANGSAKLNISFSETLGGAIGMNYRSFKDDVVVIMKRKLPLIGVRRWSDIHPTVHRLIVADMIVRTTFFHICYFILPSTMHHLCIFFCCTLYRTDGTWKIHQKLKKKFSKLRWSDIEAGDQL
jgi:hypothetical protein